MGEPTDRKANLKSFDYLIANREKSSGYQRWIDKTENLVYVDLDHVRDAATGAIEQWAKTIIEALNTYCEISASGSGFHLVCRGTLPEDFYWPGHPVEIYSGHVNKLMAMTGDVFNLNVSINDRQPQVEALLQEWLHKAQVAAGVSEPSEDSVKPSERNKALARSISHRQRIRRRPVTYFHQRNS